jgi:hypothetical protein
VVTSRRMTNPKMTSRKIHMAEAQTKIRSLTVLPLAVLQMVAVHQVVTSRRMTNPKMTSRKIHMAEAQTKIRSLTVAVLPVVVLQVGPVDLPRAMARSQSPATEISTTATRATAIEIVIRKTYAAGNWEW